MSKSYFKAPQKALKSSWNDTPFSKAKSNGPVVKRSLGNRPMAIIKDRGQIASTSSSNHSNLY